jgi:two-component system sensor histidine kinase KdpD
VYSALKWGVRPAVLSSIISTFLYDYIFIPPYLRFAVTDVWYFITLISMIGIGILTSVLAGTAGANAGGQGARGPRSGALFRDTVAGCRPDNA